MVEETQVLGSWSHSHEEDHNGRQTFRPADYPFPPARGRTTFTLLPDHRAVVGLPGADDRGTAHDGTWSIEHSPDGDVLRVALPDWAATYLILTATAEQLVLQPTAPSR